MNQKRAGYTKGGFSKGFSCCSSWKQCSMGKLDCAIEHKDPEAKKHCSCYQRNHEQSHQTHLVEIKKNTAISFNNSSDELLVTYIGENPYSSLVVGEDYILKPTRDYCKKTALVYQIDGTFKGRKYFREFKIIKENSSISIGDEIQKEITKPNKETVLEPEEIRGQEQLSLF
jgi:hypothetical protein